ncbi:MULTISPECIES: DEAD/DEAH box helicase family protein [unclassified Mesorhizobium]|uniref:DEAD/DEAH box helicase family protein n=1 Tax=unclassified Mesorhizobium TaxID=325217 RepID=UPI0003CEEDA5|nr:DEAD/DEAH box helicase family protein [Mesorhizobium sp. LSJC269B00]ESW93120.1 DNA helicase [Mesorhizobium sp. LSJC269B00]
MTPFLDDRRLLRGPWQAFERDVARLLIYAGFDDVRVVGGTGDKGADIVGVKNGEIWVVQCKHTTTAPANKFAVQEAVEAGTFYGANRMVVATSRAVGGGLQAEIDRYRRIGVNVELLDPAKLAIMAARIPEYSKSRRELRPYQQDALARFREGLTDTGRSQIVLATGLGKTVVMAEVVSDMYRDGLIRENRVLVLADKRELVRQLQFGFWYQLPKWVPTHLLSGDETPSFYDGITFATVQSVIGRVDDLPSFGLVLVDEAHHIGSTTFRRALEALEPPMVGGVTATPWRGDGFDIDAILGKPLVRLGISDGLKNRYLSEVDYRLLADNIDWKFVQDRSVHNYSLNQLNKKLIMPTRDEEAARQIAEVFKHEERRGGIVFSPTVDHAESFAGSLRGFSLRAESISSRQDARERDRLMAMFRRGDIDLLTSVDLFNEGVDVPDVDLIVFMRATHSRRIFVQQLGRGLRLSPGKDKVVVLDFVTDLRRIAELVELQKAASGPLERLPLGHHLINFRDASAGSFMFEWMKDQADLMLREGDAQLEMPRFDFPDTPQPGGVA